jgi:ferrous iron transport protein A
MNLTELKIGQNSRITKIGSVVPIRRRLMDMGVLVGEQIKIDKVAPMGDPIEVTIKNYKLSLRKNEAVNIDVEVI